ncbi:MAG: MFS transporter [Eubacteriaceae bacterium]|nr:MFS transporter [Eubacteriaceae bacterium]
MRKELSKTLKTFYGIGDLGFAMMTSVELFFFVFFLTNVAKFSLPMVALIGSITSIVDAILSPVYGAWLSGTKPLKWGRYRSWMLIGPPIVVVLFMLQFTRVSANETISAVVVCLGFILSHIIWNLAWVSNVTMITVLGKTPEERGLLASRRGTWNNMSGVFFSYIGAPLALYLGTVTNNPVLGYTLLAGVMAFAMLCGYWTVFKMTDGYEDVVTEVTSSGTAPKHDKVPVSAMLKNLFQNPPLIVLLVFDFFRWMAFFILTASAAFYFTYVAKDMTKFPMYVLLGAIAAVIGAYLAGPMSNKLSTRTTSIIGLFFGGAFLVAAKFVGYQYVPFLIMLLMARLFLGVLTASNVALYSDVVTYGEWKTGENASGFIMGIMNVSLKTAVIARGTVIPAVLAAAGFAASADPATASKAITDAVLNVTVFIPGMLLLVGGVIMILGYKLTREKLTQYQTEIDARKKTTVA